MKKTKKYAWVMDALGQSSLSVKARALKYFLSGKKEYLSKKKMNADLDALMKCGLCPNMCRFDCPVAESAKSETMTPSGRSRLSFLFETDHFVDEELIDALYTCCMCDACKNWCPFDFSLGDLLKGVHQDNVSKDLVPSYATEIKQTLVTNHRLNKQEQRISAKKSDDASVLFFMGCSVQDDHPEIAEAMGQVFDKSDVAYTTLEEEWCCAAPLYNLGFIDEFKRFAEKNRKKIMDTGCKRMVCSCPTCAYMFEQIYPEFGVELPVEIVHSSQYLFDVFNTEELRVSKNDEQKKFVYHDPCTLARKLKIIVEPRKLLGSVTGLQLSFPFCEKELTHCCGRGGSLFNTHPDLSEKITKHRIDELKENADTIITGCPNCKSAFQQNDVSVVDISELINNCLKEE